ncbi:hypothetical protein E2562_004874 [Oryza meyeriana var. granulata]|uniref:Uncharacterized protein n=1 Tax=Oryza meyeriana var. granulata TaxID=110450 RepID=A0A6G1C3Y7_9ORYZ|nr:hypothetical protein E2562_004874 [Oryza meyeriana var. granulata]
MAALLQDTMILYPRLCTQLTTNQWAHVGRGSLYAKLSDEYGGKTSMHQMYNLSGMSWTTVAPAEPKTTAPHASATCKMDGLSFGTELQRRPPSMTWSGAHGQQAHAAAAGGRRGEGDAGR